MVHRARSRHVTPKCHASLRYSSDGRMVIFLKYMWILMQYQLETRIDFTHGRSWSNILSTSQNDTTPWWSNNTFLFFMVNLHQICWTRSAIRQVLALQRNPSPMPRKSSTKLMASRIPRQRFWISSTLILQRLPLKTYCSTTRTQWKKIPLVHMHWHLCWWLSATVLASLWRSMSHSLTFTPNLFTLTTTTIL